MKKIQAVVTQERKMLLGFNYLKAKVKAKYIG
jgi:hypothetical protein